MYPVALASLLALFLLAVVDRRRDGAAPTALGLTFLAPALLVGAWLALEHRLALGHAERVELYAVAYPAYAAPIVAGLCGRLGSRMANRLLRRERAWLPPALRAASLAASALATALVAVAALRLIQRPGLDRYVASLPVVAVVPPVEGAASRIVGRAEGSFRGSLGVHDLPVAGFVVSRACGDGLPCAVSLGTAEHPPSPNVDSVAATVRETSPLFLRRDSAEDLVLLEPTDEPVRGTPLAFRGPLLEPTDLFPRDLRGAAGPPLAWLAVCAAGVLFAGSIQRRRGRAREHLARLADAASGTRDESGWITFDEPLPGLRLTPDDDEPTGPVLVVPGAAARAATFTYRSAGPSDAVEVLSGGRDELMTEARNELVRLDALALAATLLAAVPLVVAAWRGFVF
ncbi:hypothetical protein [Sorangium sp. So ce1000]|uniref:hypothetical protein n=1 Tax=Sorangium sp. So ce1000 TaxID=3133325 RepID=UPI003F5DE2B1